MQRKKSDLQVTQKGQQLISVLPEKLTSATLTAEWEQQLQKIEQGQGDAKHFYSQLLEYISETVKEFAKGYKDEQKWQIDKSNGIFANCPKCNNNMYASSRAYTCEKCGFALFRGEHNAYFIAIGLNLTAALAKQLLEAKQITVQGLKSKKSGKKYNARILLDISGKYANFKMAFMEGDEQYKTK